MNIDHIFLDIDDVCNRFTLYALQVMGADISIYDESIWNPAWGRDIVRGVNELTKQCFSTDSFWNSLPEIAWSETPVSAEFDMLLRVCSGMVGREGVCLLSTPTRCPLSCSGKIKWIHKYAPKWIHRQYLLGPQKHLCAQPNALLVDDMTENVSQFRLFEGKAILVPRPWNIHHKIALAGLTEEYLRREFELIQKGCGTW